MKLGCVRVRLLRPQLANVLRQHLPYVFALAFRDVVIYHSKDGARGIFRILATGLFELVAYTLQPLIAVAEFLRLVRGTVSLEEHAANQEWKLRGKLARLLYG